jgi:hypothetical protein
MSFVVNHSCEMSLNVSVCIAPLHTDCTEVI